MITALGTVIGAAAFVATIGISSTLGQQVSTSFDVRRATEVLVAPASDATDPMWSEAEPLARLRSIAGVLHAGRRVDLGELGVQRSLDASPAALRVFGADPAALAVIGPRVTVGRAYDDFHERSAAPMVLLSAGASEALGVFRPGAAIFINDKAFTVSGIFDQVQRRPEALLGVVMPASAADELSGPDAAATDVLIETQPGAAQLVAEQAPFALLPTDPEALRVIAPPDPRTLRREVESTVQSGSLILAVVAFVFGGLVIANSATAAISTRIHEIGLRRALGARPAHILAQLLGETTALGVAGGAVGVVFGMAVTAIVSLVNRWSPVLSIETVAAAVAASAGVGLVAGLWPGVRAMQIQPVTALAR